MPGAMSASMDADFSKFVDECNKAGAAISGIYDQADKTAKGVSDSADKMGKKMEDMRKKTEEANDPMNVLGKAAGALGVSLSLAFAVEKVTAFWTEVVKSADAMQDMADQTGMTTSQVAKLQAVAESAGLQVEDMAKASAKLNSSMDSGDGQTALGRLGLDAERLRAADPYDQLQQVARALGQVTDKGERLRLQQDLLGEGSTKLARVMNESFEETANAAVVASNESIAAVAALASKYEEVKSNLMAFATEGLGSMLRAVEDMKALDWREILKAASLSETTTDMILNLRLLKEQKDAALAISGGGPKPWMDDPSTWGGGPTREQLQAAAAARKKLEAEQDAEWKKWEAQEQERVNKVAEAQTTINEIRKGGQAILASMSDATRAQVTADLELGASQETISTAMGLSRIQVQAVADALKDQKKAADAAADAAKFVATETKTFYAESASQAASSLQAQTLAIGTWRADTMAKLAETKGATLEQYEAIARIADEKLKSVGINWNTLKEGSIQTLRDQYTVAENTYQRMFQNSSDYTKGAIENAQKERDARLAALQAAEGAHSQMYAAWLAREQAFAASITKFDSDRAAQQGASMDAQTAALDEAIAYAQAYGVSLADAQKALGQVTDAGTRGMQNVAAATGQATAQMNNLAAAASTAYARAIAGANLMKAYSDAGVAMSGNIGLGGYEFKQLQQTGVPGGLAAKMWAQGTAPGAGQVWGNQNTLNVNVNNASANDIATKLVTEMRHSGVKL